MQEPPQPEPRALAAAQPRSRQPPTDLVTEVVLGQHGQDPADLRLGVSAHQSPGQAAPPAGGQARRPSAEVVPQCPETGIAADAHALGRHGRCAPDRGRRGAGVQCVEGAQGRVPVRLFAHGAPSRFVRLAGQRLDQEIKHHGIGFLPGGLDQELERRTAIRPQCPFPQGAGGCGPHLWRTIGQYELASEPVPAPPLQPRQFLAQALAHVGARVLGRILEEGQHLAIPRVRVAPAQDPHQTPAHE